MAVSNSTFQITGMAETLEIFQQLANEIGDKKANSKILLPAVKEAMKPVLAMAKQLAPKGETHLLADSLTIVGRRPTRKDMQSKYVTSRDTVIAVVTTRKIPKKLKKQFASQNASLISDYSKSTKGSEFRNMTAKQIRSRKISFYAGMGIPYDGRAPANEWGTKTEFGTAHNTAQPFMRPAMETKAKEVANLLGQIIKQKIEKYRSKTAK